MLAEYLQLQEIAEHFWEQQSYSQAAEIYEMLARNGFRPLNSALGALDAYSRSMQLDNEILARVLLPLQDMPLEGNVRNLAEREFLKNFQDNEVLLTLLGNPQTEENKGSEPGEAAVFVSDIDRFYRAFDLAENTESFTEKINIYTENYLLPGTQGLRDFAAIKFDSMTGFTSFVESHRDYYQAIRDTITDYQTTTRRVETGIRQLQAIYPESTDTDVYLVIGQHTSFGTVSSAGLLIGMENIVDADTPVDTLPEHRQPVVASMESLPFIVVHEYVHFNQTHGGDGRLLGGVITEGVADFLAELALGNEAYIPPYRVWGEEHEAYVKSEFVKDINSRDWSRWLATSPEHLKGNWFRDLGYFIGYRIARAFYEQADDKDGALIVLLNNADPDGILRESAYLAE